MKIFISADLEGVNGVVAPEDVEEVGSGYQQAREFFTEEINAVARGAFKGGATEVVVCDSHNVSANIRLDMIDDRIQVVKGDTRPESMVDGLDETYDGAIFLGYHAKFGTQNAILDHTFNPKTIRNITVNGISVGELGFNAFFAAGKGVPVLLTTGDTALRDEAKAFDDQIETVVVKYPRGRFCARCLPRVDTQRMLEDAGEKVVKNINDFEVMELPEKFYMEITFQQVNLADGAMRVPGIKRVDSMTVGIEASSTEELMAIRQVIFNAAGGFYNPLF